VSDREKKKRRWGRDVGEPAGNAAEVGVEGVADGCCMFDLSIVALIGIAGLSALLMR
jgi:hypothetical protein